MISVLKRVARVPDEYQEVEYIQTTGTQYIDLTYSYVINDEIECDFIMDNTTGANQGVFGNGNAGLIGTSLYIDTSTKLSVTVGGILGQQFYKWATPLTTGQKYSVKIAGDALYVNGSVVLNVANTLSNGTQSDFSIFRRWGTNSLVGKIYKMSIKRSGVYIFNFVPCYRKSDNVIGLYDLVSGVFQTNSGTGTFLKGGNIAPYTAERQSINVLEMTLPKEYQQVEYIESTGTQYIDTGVKPNNTSYEIVMSNPTSTVTVGTYAAGVYSTPRIMLYFQTTLNYIRTNVNGVLSDEIPLYNGLTTAKYDNTTGIFSYNGEQKQMGSQTFSSADNFYLFAANNGGTPYRLDRIQTLRIHSAKLWNSNTLVRDYIPCYRKSDNEIGIYDLVSGTFFTNSGTGTFAKGDNVALPIKRVRACLLEPVLPSAYQQVEYIESSGTQYIEMPFDNTSTNINKYEFKYMHRDAVLKSSTILGNNNDYNRIGQLWFRTDGTTRMSIGNIVSSSSVFSVDTILGRQIEATVEVDNVNKRYSVVYDGSEYNNISFTGSSQTPNGLKILASGATDTQAANIALYAIMIYGDNNLLFKGIPCYRKSDSVVGLYDLVTKTFYTNSGTGTFSKGADATKYNIIRL